MDRFGLGGPGHLQDSSRVQIRLGGGRRTDVPGFVGNLDMQGVTIEFRIDGDCPQAHFLGSPDYANRNLASVRD